MQDLGYDQNENDDEADHDFDNYQRRARQLLIDTTKEEFRKQSRKGGVYLFSTLLVCSFRACSPPMARLVLINWM